MNPASSVTESRIHKKSMNFMIHSVKVCCFLVGEGGGGRGGFGGGTSPSPLIP